MITTIYIGGWRLDQQGDESVEVNSSVLDITDITKNTGDYTKTFTVPASKRNNIIFKHWYDANIDNSFDARTKVDGEILLDGILFKKGKFRLSKVNVKKNVADSYTINFFGNLVSLKDTIGKDELSDLGYLGVITDLNPILNNLNHDYNSVNVELGLKDGLFNKSIIYNLLAKKQYYYKDNVLDNGQSDTSANIAIGGGVDTGVKWDDLKPSMKHIRIIEAIEEKYSEANGYPADIIFSRDFFGSSEFNALYMWLNPSADKQLGGDNKQVDFTSESTPSVGVGGFMNLSTNTGSYYVNNGGAINTWRFWYLYLYIYPEVDYETVNYDIVAIIDGQEYQVNSAVEDGVQFLSLPVENDITLEVSYEVRTTQEFKYTAKLDQQQYKYIGSGGTINATLENRVETQAALFTIESNVIISEELPKIKIIDYLKGLFNIFKLVVIPQDDGTLYVDTLNSYYSGGETYDVTKYIDFENYTVNRGKILNEISLKYSEPQTIVNQQFEKNNGRGYGDTEVILREDPTDPTSKPLDGDSLTFTLPFEQVVYERLPDLESGELTNLQYGAIIDEDLNPVNPKPLIFYNFLLGDPAHQIAFIDDTGSRAVFNASVNTPFHSYWFENPNYSVLFEAEFSTWDGSKLVNSLYSNHYEDYVLSIFNVKKRSWVFKAVLPLHIITNLELNDTLLIKGNYYRIDKYTYNLLTGETTFTLINNFDDTIGQPKSNITSVKVDYRSQTETIQVTNLQGSSVTKIDNGSGTTWATITTSNNNMSIAFDEFSTETGATRIMQVQVNRISATPEEIPTVITLYQSDKGYIPSFDFSDSRNSQNISLITQRT